MNRACRVLVPLAVTLSACPEPTDDVDDTDTDSTPAVCVADPPEALQRYPGWQGDGTFLSLDGREATPAGDVLRIEGFPARIAVAPSGGVAYVASSASDDRAVFVVDVDTWTVRSRLDRSGVFPGLALSPDGGRLWVPGGASNTVWAFDADDAGDLTRGTDLDVGGYAAGLVLDDAEDRLFVGLLLERQVVEVDLATDAVVRTVDVDIPPYALLYLPDRGELWAGEIAGEEIVVIDVDTFTVSDRIDLPFAPMAMARSADGASVLAAVANASDLAVIDVASHTVTGRHPIAGTEVADDAGDRLANSNPNGVLVDADRDRVYVTRGADNAIAVLDADTYELVGQIPTGVMPTDMALTPDGATLLVTEGKGSGAGPGNGAKDLMTGSASKVDLVGLDLLAATTQAEAAFRRPLDRFPFTCDGTFPVPDTPGEPTPIEHVVLVVKENKTFDCVLGDLEGDFEADPEYVRWGREITPNLHALATTFAASDNFYVLAPESDTGHTWLTTGTLTEYAERAYLEQSQSGAWLSFPLETGSVPLVGNLFTHLLDHDIDFRVHGEIVGMFAESPLGRGTAITRTDATYPGGAFYNTSVEDEARARYLLDRWANEGMPQFTYLLFPNDHTNGTARGSQTPESMVADNDFAVGVLVEGLSQMPVWEHTLVIVLEDDPQGCGDHVDAHRSVFLAISPWVKRGYVSHVQASFASVFATVERILGLPPLGRPDGGAAPMWDLFTTEPDTTPYTALPRNIPRAVNGDTSFAADWSATMDFSGPDRNPALGPLLDAYRQWQMGRMSRSEAEHQLAALKDDPALWDALEEEALEDGEAFDAAWAQYAAWLTAQQLPVPVRPGQPLVPTVRRAHDDDDDDDD
ncbi:MAG: hypothetical protein H6733_03700 [Alphaproteobacteria bacterium]|nr:hypothetical protein [Alphaproteobacteria bacterium]